jgi:hypothetical protein
MLQLHVYHGENKLLFNEMMMMSALYKTNMITVDSRYLEFDGRNRIPVFLFRYFW